LVPGCRAEFVDGVVRWRRIYLKLVIAERFGVDIGGRA
jgi:hypothetical protein